MSETTGNEAGAPRRAHRVYSLELKQQIVLEALGVFWTSRIIASAEDSR